MGQLMIYNHKGRQDNEEKRIQCWCCKTVLLVHGIPQGSQSPERRKQLEEIKQLNKAENIFGAPTKDRAEKIYNMVAARILGSNEYADSDVWIFFKNKQVQDEKVAGWTEATIKRLGTCYKTMLFEAGMTDKGKTVRAIKQPILDPVFSYWLMDNGMELIAKAIAGVR